MRIFLSIWVLKSRRFFQYNNLPFGLNDAMRVLTKLFRSPLERWRKDGICVFIHVDDGLGIVRGREEAVRASKRVREHYNDKKIWMDYVRSYINKMKYIGTVVYRIR